MLVATVERSKRRSPGDPSPVLVDGGCAWKDIKTERRFATHRSLQPVGRDDGPTLDQDTIQSAHPRPGTTIYADPGKEEGREEEGGDDGHGRRERGAPHVG